MGPIVVFGEHGQVAHSLATGNFDRELRFFGRTRIDPRALESVAAIIASETPSLVLNAAAYTQVDLAEKEPEAAYALNAELPRRIADACTKSGVPFVHISTDYVFDGTKIGPYLETDAPNPLGVYGASKLAGDRAIVEMAGVPYAILRASWVFSHVGETFPRKILRRARELGELRVVADQVGCPTPADELAKVMMEMGNRLIDGDARAQGLFNYCGDEAMSWFDFASRLVSAAQNHGLGRCSLEPIGTNDLQLAASRPANSVLDCHHIQMRCEIRPAPVASAIARTAELLMNE